MREGRSAPLALGSPCPWVGQFCVRVSTNTFCDGKNILSSALSNMVAVIHMRLWSTQNVASENEELNRKF